MSGRGGRPWQRKRKAVFERDNYRCQECLKIGKLTFVNLHGRNAGICDHIIPLSAGGTDDDANLQTICPACDKAKTHAESLAGRGG
ncbi:HNH endonuclease [Methylophaga sp. OBS4]|uniref:HNH endonuclease n=1 Tax=Methylophaga sp. OBS4 TaxID=2991935 RepID=UPI003A4C527D